ncbi:hypothetical protein SAMN02910292_00810 [Lachnospiraceae bacterium XBB2008]|nr:hypothetical protein SAMN02910292_00810 [Lachnospiraceae bacterium XBB2008]
MKDRLVIILFLILLSVGFWFILPFGMDMQFHMVRIGELAREMSAHGFGPVYMYRDLYGNYGYPIPIFYGGVFLYPAALLVMAGLDVTIAYRIMVVAVLWITYFTAYKCFGTFFAKRGAGAGYAAGVDAGNGAGDAARLGHIAAFVYTAQPFFLRELFYRGALGGALVFNFVPVCLLGLWIICDEDKQDRLKGILYLGAGMAGIIWSHLISAVLVTIALFVVVVVVLICRKGRSAGRIIGRIALSALVCLMLGIAYIGPMLEQLIGRTYRGSGGVDFWTTSESFVGMLIPEHLAEVLSVLTHRQVPTSVVGGAVVPVLLLTVYLIVSGRIRKLTRAELTLLIVYLILHVSLAVSFIWKALEPVFGFMQSIGRLYLVISCLGAVLAILLLTRFREDGYGRMQISITLISAVYMTVFFFGYFFARNVMQDKMEAILGHEITPFEYSTDIADDLYIPVEVDMSRLNADTRSVSLLSEDPEVVWDQTIDEDNGAVYIDIERASASNEMVFEVPFMMYKGYSAACEGSETGKASASADDAGITVTAGNDGMCEVHIHSGTTGRIAVSYTGTLLQKITCVISVLSTIALAVAAVVRRKRRA